MDGACGWALEADAGEDIPQDGELVLCGRPAIDPYGLCLDHLRPLLLGGGAL